MVKKVCIIGLGYVGLPLACLCAEKGISVSGLDLDMEKVNAINSGKSPLIDDYLEKAVPRLYKKITATGNAKEAMKASEVIILSVPTPMKNGNPDLGALMAAAKTIAENLKECAKKPLVIVESTVYPGTTGGIVRELLEKSGMRAGKNFFLGHCPERIDPGNKKWTIGKIPRVVCCTTEEGNKKAKAFYESIVDAEITVLGSVIAAEAVKIFENTFRDINIAYVNELAKSFDKMGIDIIEVIKGASTKPFGFMPFYPGPGVGGHCITKDPCYLIASSRKAGFDPKFLQLARDINNSMPEYSVFLLKEQLKKLGIEFSKAKIALLGIAYKADVDDPRESPAIEIKRLIEKEKPEELRIFDPFIAKQSNADSLKQTIEGCDGIVLCTAHSKFLKTLTPDFLKENKIKFVLDCRNCLNKKEITAKGILYKGIGA